MEDSAIVATLRSGSTEDTFLALASEADSVWLAADPSADSGVGVAIIGTTTVQLGVSGLLSIHTHATHEMAHGCSERSLREALAAGYQVQPVDRDVLRDALPASATRTPDAFVEVAGRQAEVYFV